MTAAVGTRPGITCRTLSTNWPSIWRPTASPKAAKYSLPREPIRPPSRPRGAARSFLPSRCRPVSPSTEVSRPAEKKPTASISKILRTVPCAKATVTAGSSSTRLSCRATCLAAIPPRSSGAMRTRVIRPPFPPMCTMSCGLP